MPNAPRHPIPRLQNTHHMVQGIHNLLPLTPRLNRFHIHNRAMGVYDVHPVQAVVASQSRCICAAHSLMRRL